MPRLVQTVPVSDLITEMGDRRQQQTCQDSRLLRSLFLRTESAKFQPISYFDRFSKLGLLRLISELWPVVSKLSEGSLEILQTQARNLQTLASSQFLPTQPEFGETQARV